MLQTHIIIVTQVKCIVLYQIVNRVNEEHMIGLTDLLSYVNKSI